MVERVSARDVVHQKCSGSTSVITPCDRTERFLASSVPDLQLYLFGVDGDHAGSELHSDGEVVHRLEPFVGELEEETGLSDSRVSDDDVFEEVSVRHGAVWCGISGTTCMKVSSQLLYLYS